MTILWSSGIGRGRGSQKSSSRSCRAVSDNEGSSTNLSAYKKFDLPILFSPRITACESKQTSTALKLRKLVIRTLLIRTGYVHTRGRLLRKSRPRDESDANTSEKQNVKVESRR